MLPVITHTSLLSTNAAEHLHTPHNRYKRNMKHSHSFFPNTSSLYMIILPKKSVEEGKVRRREVVVRGWGRCRVWGVPTSSRGQRWAVCHPLLPSSWGTSTTVSAAPQKPPWNNKLWMDEQYLMWFYQANRNKDMIILVILVHHCLQHHRNLCSWLWWKYIWQGRKTIICIICIQNTGYIKFLHTTRLKTC